MKQNKSRLDFSHVWGVHWQVWRTAVGRVSPAFHEVILLASKVFLWSSVISRRIIIRRKTSPVLSNSEKPLEFQKS